MKTWKHILISVLALFAFTYLFASAVAGESERETTLETLHGIELDKTKIRFSVKSYGCTAADDFIYLFRSEGGKRFLSIERKGKDRCKRMPRIITIIKQLDVEDWHHQMPFVLENPLTSP